MKLCKEDRTQIIGVPLLGGLLEEKRGGLLLDKHNEYWAFYVWLHIDLSILLTKLKMF